VENSQTQQKHWRKYHRKPWHNHPTQLSKIEVDIKKACAKAQAFSIPQRKELDFAT
jgi:hypothetical protein